MDSGRHLKANPGREQPVTISLVATPEVDASALAGLQGIFNTFSQMVPDGIRFSAQIVTPDSLFGEATQTSLTNVMGFTLPMQQRLSQVTQTDVLIIPSLYLLQQRWPANPYPQLTEWINRMHDQGSLICSTCTGAFLLAETGLLDGQPATQHWAFEQLFQSAFPRVRLCIDKVLIQTGASGRIIMTGASAAWHDLAVYLVSRYAGNRAASTISRFFLLSTHQDGQAPYILFQENTRHGDSLVLAAQRWLRAHSSEPGPVETMTRNSGLIARTFNRRFIKATGLTPIRYVQQLRIAQATQLLEESRTSVDEISWQVGYEDAAFFRRLFKRLTGMTPRDYRRKFYIDRINY